MRCLMEVTLHTEKFNEELREGRAIQTINRIIEETRPEATYFCARECGRTCYLVVDVANETDIPKYAEPWSLNFNAVVEFFPTMTPKELQGAGITDIVKKWK